MAFRYSGFPPQTTEMAALCQRFRIPASNASVYTNAKKPSISYVSEIPGFCLLRRCPNPRRTQICVLETLQEMQRLRDFAIAETER